MNISKSFRSRVPRRAPTHDVREKLVDPPFTIPVIAWDAMLLLLATYGLRAREVAARTLHDFDWRRGRLAELHHPF